MMLGLLMAASIATAVDAERAFAADAHKLGQWTAFRKWSTDDAVMFVPQPVNAQQWLKDKKDPPVSVFWWPGRSYVSCDGSYSVNTGPWVRGWGKSVGYFTTVWQRQSDGGWKWTYDAGDELGTLRPEGGEVRHVTASCTGTAAAPADAPPIEGARSGSGASADGTLRWSWIMMPDGARAFRAYLWNGAGYDQVISDTVRAP